MPLLDIAISHPIFQNLLGTLKAQPQLHGNISSKFTFGKDKRLASTWKVSIQIPSKANFKAGHLEMQSALQIREVLTLESKCFVQSVDGHKDDHNMQLGPDSNPQVFQSPSEDSVKMDESERLRRMRISKANKGTIPWNKGRKHSAETLRLIGERTKLAMQDPKVRMKLVNLGHSHSEVTRIKIGVGVRMGWQRRREKLLLQKTCYLQWQNLIAEASRRGYDGEVQMHWDSYKILDVQLQQEWLESIKQRKSAPRPKVCKRAPKSPEQRRKISEAISAKWADPGYRERVCSAMTKYHGMPVGAERKRMKRPCGTQSIRRSLAENNPSETYFSGSETKSQGWSGLKRSSAPSYGDPLENSKLKMIKKIRMKRPTGERQSIRSREEKKPSDAYNFYGNEIKRQGWSGLKRTSALSYKDLAKKVRAQRAAMETKKKEAIERAKLLIAEAEKAAKALELVAMKSPIAGASLMESRKLVAEATRLIEEIGQITPRESKTGNYHPCLDSYGLISHFEEETVTRNGDLSWAKKREVDRIHIYSSISSKNEVISNVDGKLGLQEFMKCGEEPSGCCVLPPLQPNSLQDSTDEQMVLLKPNASTNYHRGTVPNGVTRMQAGKAKTSSKSAATTKKWFRGRLVEVAADELANGR